MNRILKEAGVRQRTTQGCKCKKNRITLIYTLPMKIDVDIAPLLKPLGTSGTSFEKTSLLRIETPVFSIVAVKRLKEIKLIFKTENDSAAIELFENALVEYINLKGKK